MRRATWGRGDVGTCDEWLSGVSGTAFCKSSVKEAYLTLNILIQPSNMPDFDS
jgi:hypothetical protein